MVSMLPIQSCQSSVPLANSSPRQESVSCRIKTDGPSFFDAVQAVRKDYWKLRERSNLCPPEGKVTIDVVTERVEGVDTVVFWFEDTTSPLGQCVRLVDIPGTLSGDILRLHRNLPPLQGSFEINGNVIRTISTPPLPDWSDDTEDVSTALALLPLVEVDPSKHFVKKTKYCSEIHNLLKCQGGSCPGKPLSPYINQLFGRSENDELVLEKLSPRYLIYPRFCSIAIYKRWISHLVAAVKCLHFLGIVHRDLHIENLLFSSDGQRLVVADLESHWGQRSAPEIACDDGTDSGWTEKSDIYDIGVCIQTMIYANIPVTRQVDWPVPPPFNMIVDACKRTTPEQRPSLDELVAMLDEIDDSI